VGGRLRASDSAANTAIFSVVENAGNPPVPLGFTRQARKRAPSTSSSQFPRRLGFRSGFCGIFQTAGKFLEIWQGAGAQAFFGGRRRFATRPGESDGSRIAPAGTRVPPGNLVPPARGLFRVHSAVEPRMGLGRAFGPCSGGDRFSERPRRVRGIALFVRNRGQFASAAERPVPRSPAPRAEIKTDIPPARFVGIFMPPRIFDVGGTTTSKVWNCPLVINPAKTRQNPLAATNLKSDRPPGPGGGRSRAANGRNSRPPAFGPAWPLVDFRGAAPGANFGGRIHRDTKDPPPCRYDALADGRSSAGAADGGVFRPSGGG